MATEHLKAYVANPSCRVVAIGSRTKEGAAAKARQVGLDPDEIGIYDDYDALLAHPGLDALSICTPHARHASETIAAAQAGKHILIEKPIALTIEDCRTMIAATRSAGVQMVVGHSHSFDAPYLRTRSLIEGGDYGAVRLINALNYTDFLYRPRRPEELDTAEG